MTDQTPINKNGNYPTTSDIHRINAVKNNLHARIDIDGREGLFCTDCDSVFYLHSIEAETQRDKPCPFCGGIIYWITTSDQPLEE